MVTDLRWLPIFALLGAALGHGIRRLTPALLGLRDARLPFAWPWLEALGAALLALAAWRLGTWSSFAAAAGLIAVLLAATATDYLVKLIPDLVTLGGLALGLLLALTRPSLLLNRPLHGVLLDAWGLERGSTLAALALAAVGAAVGFCLLEIIRRLFGLLVGLEVMGMGDSKLLMAAGAFLGPFGAVAATALGFLIGLVHGLAYWLRTRRPHAPFGPPLAAAALMVAFADRQLLAGWDAFQTGLLQLSIAQLLAIYAVLGAVVVWMLLRMRRRAAFYEQMIEDEYREVDERLGPAEDEP